MKKISAIIIVSSVFAVLLFGCTSKKETTDWLAGDWYAKDWKVTYTFSQQKDNWTIKSDNGRVITKKATLSSKSTQTNLTLVSSEGTSFKIKRVDKTHITFNQIAKKGMLGATKTVEFVKK